MATRRAGCYEFDHGTQFFTVKNPDFQAWLAPLIQQGIVAEWIGNVISIDAADPQKPPRIRPWPEPHYVAVPSMNSLAKHLSENLDIVLNCQVAKLPEDPHESWQLSDINGNSLGQFDWVISTAPPAQTVSLFASQLPATSPLAQTAMQGCYTLMLAFDDETQPTAIDSLIAARIRNSPIEWIAINSSKPSRDRSTTTLVAHSSNAWAQDHIDDDQAEIRAYLLTQLGKLIQITQLVDIDITQASHTTMHRWRYALKPVLSTAQSGPNAYLDPTIKLAATGDWSSASRIEDVWLSARALAAALRTHL